MAAVRSEDHFLCSICLDLFTEPVTTPCGHNFCRRCLSWAWSTSFFCRCPMCKAIYHKKPELKVNTLLSEVVSQFKQEGGRRSEVSKPGEVSCDYCSLPKLKALKSCLVCLSSYCESHLQPHLSVPRLKSHQLMEPVDNMEDRMCPQHHKPLEMLCCSDHSLLCIMCALLEHKGHTFQSMKEMSEQIKAYLQQMLQKARLWVQERKKKIQEIQSSVQLSQRAADQEKSKGLKAFSTLIQSVQRSRERFLQNLQDKQKKTQAQAEALVQQLKQEIQRMEQWNTTAGQLQRSKDHLHVVRRYSEEKLGGLVGPQWLNVNIEPPVFEGTAVQALCELRQSLSKELSPPNLLTRLSICTDPPVHLY